MPSCPCLPVGRGWMAFLPLCFAIGTPLPGAEPPAPNPHDPVNYIEWINANMAGDLKENAAALYGQAADQVTPLKGEWGDTTRGPWSENAEVSAWLEQHAAALEQFKKATRVRGCFFRLKPSPQPGQPRFEPMMINVVLPHLAHLRELSRGLLASGFRKWQDGDRTTLLANVGCNLRFAQHMLAQPFLIQRLVGMSCAQSSHGALRQALAQSDDRGALATAALAGLRGSDPPIPSLVTAFDTERMTALDFCQRSYESKDGKLELVKNDKIFPPELVKKLNTDYDATLKEIEANHDALRKWAAKPFHLAARETARLNRSIVDSKTLVARILTPTLTRSRELNERVVAERRATWLILQVFAHQAATRSFPKTLGELKAADLAELRVDPFSGKDFVYRVKDDGFVLYSVSQNLKDDAGRHSEKWEEADYVFWPVKKVGP